MEPLALYIHLLTCCVLILNTLVACNFHILMFSSMVTINVIRDQLVRRPSNRVGIYIIRSRGCGGVSPV